MKAVGYFKSLPIEAPDSLVDLDLPEPELGARDVLVEVRAVSVNPVDSKTRLSAAPVGGRPRVLGFDAAGVIIRTGAGVQNFKTGDAVFYAGDLGRQGSNAQLQAVDERLIALKPQSLDFTAAAALPLTGLTAYAMLFDRLRLQTPVHKGKNAVLIIGGAGGVGSMAIQLARVNSDCTVIATASRPQTADWAKKMGAHDVINHRAPLLPQLQAAGIEQAAFVFSTTYSADYLPQYPALIAPQGRFGLIDSPESFDITPFKQKSVSIHWEYMATRALFKTDDMAEQGKILTEIAALVDAGKLQPTGTEIMSSLSAATLRKAQRKIETGTSIGKLVIEY
ncbi:MAG: Zinc-binding alcohol dehydrogenase [Candidatus Tokpelaia hoelldobleri]|uniref:Zinc-type alcohol dehydrogenase-like protein n=1 Tax=Candidatus Tokpelaia hoelldobleri TaxID=1902579 RepID=A0A1U9JWJ5_9HYPH|nr:MAG: Zinc-binding alcohol dehydrogenase [Candidatus Tokpelaia hoelldoblerii]